MAESSPNGWKTLWEKEKLLVMRNFSFSHSVFKRLVLQTRKIQGLFGLNYGKKEYRQIGQSAAKLHVDLQLFDSFKAKDT